MIIKLEDNYISRELSVKLIELGLNIKSNYIFDFNSHKVIERTELSRTCSPTAEATD
jgi:hypothetical protein